MIVHTPTKPVPASDGGLHRREPMPQRERARSIADLRKSRYKALTVKQEIRKNLIKKIKKGEPLFPGIVGFEDSVLPALENAILAGQDLILLGERGQAKSRLIRHIA